MSTPLARKMAGVWCSLWKERFGVDHPAQKNKGMFAVVTKAMDNTILPATGFTPETCVAFLIYYLNVFSAQDIKRYAGSATKGFAVAWHTKDFFREFNSRPNDDVFHHVVPVGPDELNEASLPEGFVGGMKLMADFESKDRMIVIEPGSDLEHACQPVLAAAQGGSADAR